MVFAGGTVVIAILGLWPGIPFVGAMGLATAVVGGGRGAGRRHPAPRPARRRRQPHRPAAPAGPPPPPGRRAGALDLDALGPDHRPAPLGLRGSGRCWCCCALATPLLTLRLGTPDDGTLPTSATQRRAYDLLARFGALQRTAAAGGGAATGEDQAPDRRMLLDRLARAAAADDVAAVAPALRRRAVLTVVPNSSPQDQATADLVGNPLQILPTALGQRRPGLCRRADRNHPRPGRVADRLPLFIGAVVGVSFLLLVVVFRARWCRSRRPCSTCCRSAQPTAWWSPSSSGLGQGPGGPGDHGADHVLSPADVRHPLRPVHGLRGVPALPHPREYVATGDAHGSVVTAIAATAR